MGNGVGESVAVSKAVNGPGTRGLRSEVLGLRKCGAVTSDLGPRTSRAGTASTRYYGTRLSPRTASQPNVKHHASPSKTTSPVCRVTRIASCVTGFVACTLRTSADAVIVSSMYTGAVNFQF